MHFMKIFLCNPPTGHYIRDERCQIDVHSRVAENIREPIQLIYLGGFLQKKGYEMASLSFDFGSTLVIFFGMKLFDIGDVVLRCTHKIDSVFAAVSNRRALAVGVTSFIHVNSPLGLLYDLNCFRQLVELWDLEQSAALLASYPSVCRTAI